MPGLTDKLRAQREGKAADMKRLIVRVPGYSGPYLYVRYKPVDWLALDDLMDTPSDARERLANNVDALVNSCDALLVSEEDLGAVVDDPKDPRLTSLADELRASGENVFGEVKFDAYAVDGLGLDTQAVEDRLRSEGIEGYESGTARSVVLAVYDLAISPEVAVMEQAVRLGAWIRTALREADESLGE